MDRTQSFDYLESMSIELEIERTVFARFIVNHRVSRFTDLLRNEQKRGALWRNLRDTRYFDSRYCREITGAEKSPEPIKARLKSLGVGEHFYVISSDFDLDGANVSVDELLQHVGMCTEVLAFCRRSEIGVFMDHEGRAYILYKKNRT